jgi:hypothetical protein
MNKERARIDVANAANELIIVALRERIVELEKELAGYKKVAKERAEFIINGEELGYISLPESENDKAYLTFMRCQLTDEYAAIEALKEPKP